MKKQIMGCVAFLIACAAITINATAHAENIKAVVYQVNDTTPPMHHQNRGDSSYNKNKMNKKNKMMRDTMQPMRMGDSTRSGSGAGMDSTQR